jgi:VWFA-related protein
MREAWSTILLTVFFISAAGVWTRAARDAQTALVYKSDVRMVEVYATITDRSGRYVSGLGPDQFELRDNGQVQTLAAFEPVTSGFNCAILLDSTGSMQNALPVLKGAVLQLLDAFRENDWFAVYTFNTTLRKVHGFSQDKAAAKQAVLRTIASGATALFDSLSAVAADLLQQKGKKTIIVFTDGRDNASYLYSNAVIRRARSLGIPIYAVAQGDALGDRQLLRLLEEVGKSTGGGVYQVRKPSRMQEVFAEITSEIQHSYMLAYVPPPSGDVGWRTIDLTVKGLKGVRIRTREGYFPK